MKFIWVCFIVIIIINVTRAKNLLDMFLEHSNINRDLSKASEPSSHVITKRGTIGVFPSLPSWGKKYMVTLKPPTTSSPTTKLEQYKKPLMRELSTKEIDYKTKSEVTTRRSLMQAKKFTVKPHDVYQEPVREKFNFNSNRKNINNSRIPNKQGNIGKTNDKTIKNESRILNFKNVDVPLKDNDNNKSEKRENKNSHVAPDSRKSKITLQLPNGNNIKYVKGNPERSVSLQFQINNFLAENKVPFNVIMNSNNGLPEENKNLKVPSDAFKSDSKDQMDEVVEPEENYLDLDEFIPLRLSDISLVEVDGADDEETATDSDIEYLVLRPRRSANIIEEERIAPTLSGVRVTNQDNPASHDLTFKNIHT